LPPLIILMINSMVVPYIIYYIAQFEHFWQRSSQQSACLHMNIVFMVINSTIIPLMSLNSISLLLRRMGETPVNQWNTMLGASFLSSSGSFAIRYLVNSSLLSSAVQLLQIPQAVYAYCLAVSAVTPAERKRAEKRWQFDFGYWYACALSICFICLTFSAVVPLLLPCGAIFFCMKYYVDSSNFRRGVFTVDMESHGEVASAAVGYLLSAVAFMQFCMSGLFMVQGGGGALAMASTFLFACSVGTWVLLAFHQGIVLLAPHALRGTSTEQLPLQYASEKQLAALQDAYVHPCERQMPRKGERHASFYGSL